MKRVLAVGVALIVLGACGGGGGKKSAAAPTTEATPATTATTVFDADKAKADITTLYTTFFNEKTTTDDAVKLLEDGEALRPAIEAQRTSGAAAGISTSIKTIQLASPEKADVTFDILLKGAVVAPNTKGEAKWLDGRWKINKTLFCTLVGLAGQHPAACPNA
jgi:hypothetical protein